MTDRPRIDQPPGGLGQPTGTTTAEDLSATFRQTTGPQTRDGQPLRARVAASARGAAQTTVNAARSAGNRASEIARGAGQALQERGGWQEDREFVLADGPTAGTLLNDRLANPVRVTVNGQSVRLEEFHLQRQPTADAVGIAGARLVEQTRDSQGVVQYTRLRHNPNESIRLNRGRRYFVEVPLGNNQEPQRIPLEHFNLDGSEPAQPVIAPTPAAAGTPETPPPTPSVPASPREQLEARNLGFFGVKTTERRVYDLVNKSMERAKGWGRQAFKEVFEHKLTKYYSELFVIAQSPFAEEAIRLAEQKGEADYKTYWQSISPIRQAARHIIEEFKAYALKTTWVQDATMKHLTDAHDQDMTAALTRGRQMYLDAKGHFSGRFDTAFDREDLAVRKDMGEDFRRLDATNPFSQEIKTLIKQFTHGDILDEAAFNTKKDELWGRIKTANPDLLKDAEDYADTLTAVGKQYKDQWNLAETNAEGKLQIDREIDALRVALATGQMGEATSMNKTDTQKAVGKIKEFSEYLLRKNIIGASLVNEATVGTAVSYLLSVKSLGTLVVTSGARAVGGWVAGGTVAGAIGAHREKGRLTKEYWAYLGEREAGVATVAGSKKREWFDKLDVTRRKSTDVVSALREKLYNADGSVKANLTDEELQSTLGQLADAKARWTLSSRAEKRVALIEIGGVGTQEKNRTEFVRAIDQVEKDLGRYIADPNHADVRTRLMAGQEYTTFLNGITTTQTQILEKGKATFDALQQDSAQRLALTHVAGYSPEVAKVRKQILWLWGHNKDNQGTVSGLEAALKEFQYQANAEAVKRGIYTGAIGMGIGALTQEAIMDWKFAQANGWQGFGTLGHGTFLAGAKDLIGLGDGASPLVHPELVGDNFVQHSQNLHFDDQGNLDLVKPDGTLIRDDIVSATDISFDADGTFSQHTTDTLSAQGFNVAEGIDVIQPAHTAGTHPLWFGQDEVTVSNDLQWVDNGDGTSRLVLIVEDGSHNQFESLVHARSVISQGGPNDMAAVIQDIKDHPLLDFTPGHETVTGHVPPMTADIDGIPHIPLTDGSSHAISATFPTGTTLVETNDGVYSLVDANNTSHTLASGIKIDDTGFVTNANAVNSSALALENHITITNTDYHVDVAGGGAAGGFFDKPVIEMGQEKGFHGIWGWVEDPTNATNTTVDPFDTTQHVDLVNKVPITNYTKHLARTLYENDFSDIPGLKDAHFVRADGSIMPHTDIDARTYTMMYEGDTFKHLPDVMFKDDALVKVGSIAQKAINMVEQQGVDFDKATPAALGITQQEFDILKSAYEIARVGREATKDEFLMLYRYLGGEAGPSGLDLHQPQIAQQLVEAGPPAIEIGESLPNNIILAPLTEPPQIPIPIIPILRRRGLEPGTPTQPRPPVVPQPTPVPTPPYPYPGYYGGGYGRAGSRARLQGLVGEPSERERMEQALPSLLAAAFQQYGISQDEQRRINGLTPPEQFDWLQQVVALPAATQAQPTPTPATASQGSPGGAPAPVPATGGGAQTAASPTQTSPTVPSTTTAAAVATPTASVGGQTATVTPPPPDPLAQLASALNVSLPTTSPTPTPVPPSPRPRPATPTPPPPRPIPAPAQGRPGGVADQDLTLFIADETASPIAEEDRARALADAQQFMSIADLEAAETQGGLSKGLSAELYKDMMTWLASQNSVDVVKDDPSFDQTAYRQVQKVAKSFLWEDDTTEEKRLANAAMRFLTQFDSKYHVFDKGNADANLIVVLTAYDFIKNAKFKSS